MTNDVTTYNATNSFTIAAAASPQRALVGERLRFSKGRYLIGAGDTAELAAGTVLDCLDTTILWIKFIDGKVVDQRIGYPSRLARNSTIRMKRTGPPDLMGSQPILGYCNNSYTSSMPEPAPNTPSRHRAGAGVRR
jgi:hypothetical protein